MIVRDPQLQELDRAHCWTLLATMAVGRVALSDRALPVILAVQYQVGREGIVIHTTDERLARAITRSAIVCLEASDDSRTDGNRWSVTVTGQLTPADLHAHRLPAGWSTNGAGYMHGSVVSGRWLDR